MIDKVIEKYYSRVYAFALVHVVSEHLAKDLTQDVFLQLVKRKKEMQAVRDLEAYIFTVARNRTYKYFRKINSNDLLKAEALQALDDTYIDVESDIIVDDLKEKFKEFIDQLPDRQREIYHLSREKGLSYKEIAEELQISPNTVRNHLAQALKTLKLKYKLFSVGMAIIALFSILTWGFV